MVYNSGRAMLNTTTGESTLHVAIASGPDGVYFVAIGGDEQEVTSQLVDYVLLRCEFTLWADDADEVRSLLDAGGRGCDRTYFARVGDALGRGIPGAAVKHPRRNTTHYSHLARLASGQLVPVIGVEMGVVRTATMRAQLRLISRLSAHRSGCCAAISPVRAAASA